MRAGWTLLAGSLAAQSVCALPGREEVLSKHGLKERAAEGWLPTPTRACFCSQPPHGVVGSQEGACGGPSGAALLGALGAFGPDVQLCSPPAGR